MLNWLALRRVGARMEAYLILKRNHTVNRRVNCALLLCSYDDGSGVCKYGLIWDCPASYRLLDIERNFISEAVYNCDVDKVIRQAKYGLIREEGCEIKRVWRNWLDCNASVWSDALLAIYEETTDVRTRHLPCAGA